MCCQLLRFLFDWLILHLLCISIINMLFNQFPVNSQPLWTFRELGLLTDTGFISSSKINLAQTQPNEARAALWLRLLPWRSGSGPYPCEKSSMALTWSLSLEVMSWLLASSTVLLTALDRRSSSLVELVVATSSRPVLITCPITTGKTNNSCLFFLEVSAAAVLMGNESHALVKFCLWT